MTFSLFLCVIMWMGSPECIIRFTLTLLVTTEVAICRSWQGINTYDYDYSEHPDQPPWSRGFENQPDIHDWDSKLTPKPDMNDWPNRRPLHNYNMQACIASCPVPRAYDPVCGTDNVTYRTIGQLYCARQCGLAVAVSANTECFGGNNYITPKSTKPTTPTTFTQDWKRPKTVPTTSRTVTGDWDRPNTVPTTSRTFTGDWDRPNTVPTTSRTFTGDWDRPNTVPTTSRTFTGDWDRPNTVPTTSRTFTGDWDRPNTVPTTSRTFTGDWDRPNTVPTTSRTFTGDWDRPNTVPTTSRTVTKDLDRPTTASTVPSATPTDINVCITTCSKSSKNRTVCGTDGITYDNEEHIFCAQLCGVEVTMTRFSSCPEIIIKGTEKPGLTTQSPLPSPTTRQPTDVIDCMRSCPISPGYNPVCGSNGVTYTNDGQLRCAQRCGIQVTITKLGTCPGGDNNGNGNPRSTTQSPLPSPTTKQPTDVKDCMRSCLIPPGYNPVCGSNGVTYTNDGHLRCAQRCGIQVTITRLGTCPGGDNNGNGNPRGTTQSPLPSPTTRQPTDVIDCIRSCLIPPGYNPVCGSNGVTYTNDGHLRCAQRCGVQVTITKLGPCPGGDNNGNGNPRWTTQSPLPSPTTRQPTDVIDCIRSCLIPPGYNPVCGSNGVTYTNDGHLRCAQRCGVQVTVTRLGPCPRGDNNGNGNPRWTTQSPLPSPTTTQPTDVIDCMRSCPIPPGNNPVCGSNGVTYTNDGHLRCAQRCGIQVTINRLGACPGGDKNGNGKPRWTTQSPLPSPTTRRPIDVIDCIRSCLVTNEYNPICGSNGLTYDNEGHLRCAQRCGVQVTMTRLGSCTEGDKKGNGNPRWTTKQPPPNTTTRQPSDFIDCIRSCQITNEYNPVCGSNGETYTNDGHLRCAQQCGVQVTMTRLGSCLGGDKNGKENPGRTTTAPLPRTTTRLPYDVIDCIRSCLVTQEYNPVCGSDGVTYTNEGRLRCAQDCGIDVSLRRRSPCPDLPINGDDGPATLPPFGRETTISPAIRDCIRTCPVTPEYNPVCGTDDVTYTNIGRLECARNCGVAVNLRHMAGCAVSPLTTQPTFGNNGVFPNPLLIDPNKDGSPPQVTTPSSDVLDDAPTTEEADVNVDPRFNTQGRTFVNQK